MYLMYLENWRTKEHITIGVFSTFALASQAEAKASSYWNRDLEEMEYLGTISLITLDELPNYLKG